MKLYFGARIFGQDAQQLGILTEIVLQPQTQRVTHIVVRQGLLSANDKLIPVEMVEEATADEIRLRVDAATAEAYSVEYRQAEFLPMEETGMPAVPGTPLSGRVWTRPPDTPELPQAPASLVPPGIGRIELSPAISVPLEDTLLENGCPVRTADGKSAGRVSELVVDAQKRISHLRLEPAGALKEPRLVPIDWVQEFRDSELFLAVPLRLLEQLPPPDES